jgi:pimeloyl-ACP methyl ester carboxylesterase
MQSHSLRIGLEDGRVLHARTWGDADRQEKPVCLLIHGVAESSHTWDLFAPTLTDAWCPVAVDLPGHGESSWHPECNYGVAAFAHDIAAMLQRLRVNSVALLGHSLGGQVAIELTAWQDIRALGLLLVESAPEVPADAVTHLREAYSQSLRSYTSVAEFEAEMCAARPWTEPDVIRGYAAHALRQQDCGWKVRSDPRLLDGIDIGTPLVARRLWDLLSRVECPVRLVRGATSGFVSPSLARRVTETARAQTPLQVAAAGHGVMLDNPSRFAEVAHDFLSHLAQQSLVEHHI